jgi:predicted unusual protein kinase regulating ubiquinone biosynthesis (AarF/ABC1/UbiB family)
MRTMMASMSGVDRQGPVSTIRGGGSGGRGPRGGGQKGDDGDAKPYPSDQYDPVAARQYFLQRPWEAVSRAVEIASQAGSLFVSLWIDEALGRVRVMEDQRAREAVQVIIRLGPTFVKIGQSLSVRGDLLPAAYIQQLTSLTDRVPFFDDAQARAIILEDLALASLSDMFSDFSRQPVAAASIGQVYRAKLRDDGRDVAVKVQRPGASKLIACDLFLLRLVASPLLSAQILKSTPCSDFPMVYVLGH